MMMRLLGSVIVLALSVPLVAFAGGDVDAGAATEEFSIDQYEPVAGKEYVLEWAPMSTPVADDGPIVTFLEEKFNVDFRMWDKSEGAALSVRIAAGEIPDFFADLNTVYRTYVEDGVLAAIPMEALQRFAPNMYRRYQEDRPGAIEARIIDGKLWCLPQSDAETGGTRMMIAYRGDWLDVIGFDGTPDTLEELEAVMYAFAHDDPDGNGKKDTYGTSLHGTQMVYGAYGFIPMDNRTREDLPGLWHEVDGEIVYGAIQPEMKDALAVLRKWYDDGVIDPEFVQGERKGTPFSRYAFMSGQVGMTTDWYIYLKNESMVEGDRIPRNIAEMARLNPQAVETIRYGRPPVGPTGKRGVPVNTPFHSWFLGFGKHMEQEPDKMGIILQINDYANATDDGFLTTRYGFEGEHWSWQDGVVDSLVIQRDDLLQWHQITEIGGGIAFSSIWFPSIQSRVNNNMKWAMNVHPELYEDGYLDAVYLPLPSAGKYLAELEKLRDETYFGIITGELPLDAFDEFVEEWKRIGGDVLTEEANVKL